MFSSGDVNLTVDRDQGEAYVNEFAGISVQGADCPPPGAIFSDQTFVLF